MNDYMNLPSENVSVPPPSSPFIEKAIANRLSVLPPNAEAIQCTQSKAAKYVGASHSHISNFYVLFGKTLEVKRDFPR